MVPVVPAAAPPISERSILQVRGVTKHFGGLQALAGVDLDVHEGEIFGLVGPNGSGKTTLINVISGFYPLTSGTITLDGAEIGRDPAHEIARRGVARTYQIPRPFANMTVLDNVALCATFGGPRRSKAEMRDEALHWIGFTGLGGKEEVLPAGLNLHERKFLELARALAARPKLLLLDEVLSGLNPTEIDNAIRLVRAIRAQGATIVFVEHLMRAVVELSRPRRRAERRQALRARQAARGHARSARRQHLSGQSLCCLKPATSMSATATPRRSGTSRSTSMPARSCR